MDRAEDIFEDQRSPVVSGAQVLLRHDDIRGELQRRCGHSGTGAIKLGWQDVSEACGIRFQLARSSHELPGQTVNLFPLEVGMLIYGNAIKGLEECPSVLDLLAAAGNGR